MIVNFKFEKIIILLLCLFPISFVFFPGLSQIIIALVSLIMIYIALYRKYFFFFKNIYFVYFLTFCLYLIVRSLFSEDIIFSLKNSIFYFRYGIFTIAIYYMLSYYPEKILKYFFYSLFFIFFLLLFDGYFQSIFGFNLINMPLPQLYRVSSFFGEEMILGSYLTKTFPLIIAVIYFIYKENKYIDIYISSLILINVIMIFLTGERSAFFLSCLFLFLFLIFTDIISIKRKFLLLFCFLFIFSITILTNERINHRYLLQIKNSFTKSIDENQVSTKNTFYLFTFDTEAHYRSAFAMFKENILFGQGPKMFRKLCSKDNFNYNKWSCTSHPHNQYLELLAETGIVGFAFVFFIFLKICLYFIKRFINLFKKNKNQTSVDNIQLIFMCFGFATLWPFIPTGRFLSSTLSVLNFFPIGFYLFYKYPIKQLIQNVRK
jgi:O-antigen ligase